MFLNIQIDLIMLKTYDQQFNLTTKKSLHIIFNSNIILQFLLWVLANMGRLGCLVVCCCYY